jgi:type I restriction enzyme S subunit
MNVSTKNNLVPLLRFPEYRDAGEWVHKEFSKYIVLYRGSSPRPIQNYLTVDSCGVNWIKIGDTKYAKNFIISQVEEKITPEGAKKSRKVNVGELILANSMSYGKTYQVAIAGYIYDGWFVLRDYEKYFDKQFLLQLLNSEYMQNQYKKFSAGGIVQNISSDIVYKTVLPNTSLEEQQKIADCLSSIDELVTAQTQKVEALKAHKKGLMQQLFPAEGETVPKLRFPEFRDAEEWEELKLIETADKKIKWSFIGGPFGSNLKSSDYTANGVRIIQLQNIGDAEFINNYKIFTSEEKADELLSCNIYPGDIILSKMGDPVGRACLIPNNHNRYIMCSDGIRLTVDEKLHCKYFIYSLINSIQFRTLVEKTATGSTRKRIGLDDLKNLPMIVPKTKEQHKIADCLSSIDELITAKTQKLAKLKAHKKGLMQQLFPAVDEANG